jgi:hypothetical protein
MVRFVCAFTRSDNRSIFAVHGHSGETYLRTLRSRPEARAIQNIQMNSTFSITEGLTPLVLSVRFCNADKAKLEALLESSVFFVPTGSGIRRTIVQNMITICFNHNMRVLVNHLRVRFIKENIGRKYITWAATVLISGDTSPQRGKYAMILSPSLKHSRGGSRAGPTAQK